MGFFAHNCGTIMTVRIPVSPSRKILKNWRAENDILETANYRLRGRSTENLRVAICYDTGSYLVSLAGGGGITRVEGVDRGWKEVGEAPHPHPRQAGPKIPSELKARQRSPVYVYSLVCEQVHCARNFQIFMGITENNIDYVTYVNQALVYHL